MKVRIYPNCRKPNLENVWNCIACGETLSLGSLVDIENESTIKFLDELRNEDTSTRNDAIKKIINDKINDDQIIITLKDVVENDPSIAVRNFACAALDVFGVKYSTIDELVEVNSKNSEDNNSQTNETVNNPVNWLVIGLLAGLIQGLVLFFGQRCSSRNFIYTLYRSCRNYVWDDWGIYWQEGQRICMDCSIRVCNFRSRYFLRTRSFFMYLLYVNIVPNYACSRQVRFALPKELILYSNEFRQISVILSHPPAGKRHCWAVSMLIFYVIRGSFYDQKNCTFLQ